MYCVLWAVGCGLWAVGCWLYTVGCRLYRLQTVCMLYITVSMSHAVQGSLYVACHSPVGDIPPRDSLLESRDLQRIRARAAAATPKVADREPCDVRSKRGSAKRQVENIEQRAESREQRAESREQRAVV